MFAWSKAHPESADETTTTRLYVIIVIISIENELFARTVVPLIVYCFVLYFFFLSTNAAGRDAVRYNKYEENRYYYYRARACVAARLQEPHAFGNDFAAGNGNGSIETIDVIREKRIGSRTPYAATAGIKVQKKKKNVGSDRRRLTGGLSVGAGEKQNPRRRKTAKEKHPRRRRPKLWRTATKRNTSK